MNISESKMLGFIVKYNCRMVVRKFNRCKVRGIEFAYIIISLSRDKKVQRSKKARI